MVKGFSESAVCADRGSCPLDTYGPFKKGAILNFFDRIRED